MFLNINDLPRPVQGPFQVPEGGDAPASGLAVPCRVISLLGIEHPHLAGTAGEVGGPQVQVVFLPDDFGVTVPWEAVAAQFAVADSGFRLCQTEIGKRLLRQFQYRLGGLPLLP